MKPTVRDFVVALLFLELLALPTINTSFCNGSSFSYVGCIESERRSLLEFKKDLDDPSNRLASWIGDGDCCKWAGVFCDNLTGHVVELHLGNPSNHYDLFESQSEYEVFLNSELAGKLNPSLMDLKHLIHLDLSGNDFRGIHIPKYLGCMEKLRYLDLSGAEFAGMVPHQIGNLSNLQYLDLSYNDLHDEKFSWLSGISSLQNLDLSFVNLSKASDWLLAINSLPSLKVLQLSGCQLLHFPPLSTTNFTFLDTLDLSFNNFDDSSIPRWVFGLCHLVFLNLKANHFQGPIPNELGNLTSLRCLDLSFNQFDSTIPDWFSKFNNLQYLSLGGNSLQGTISSGLGNLTCLRTLDLSFNVELEGKMPRSFERLCNLRSIGLSDIKLSQELSQVLDIFSTCVAFELESLDLSFSQLSGRLTNQLGEFKNIYSLDLSNNNISGPLPPVMGDLSFLRDLDLSLNKLEGSIPLSFGKLSSLEHLDLSHNKLNGSVSQIHFGKLTKLIEFSVSGNSLILRVNSTWVPPFQLYSLFLSSCHLGPKFPSWLHSQKHLGFLDLSNTGIADAIPGWFWKSIFQYDYLSLSHNRIHGEIPNLTGNRHISFLDLSSNNFSGPLPSLSLEISFLDLSNNALSGSIFRFICCRKNMSKSMKFLKLAENSLSGEIPDCWNLNWPNLFGLNLSHNKFIGSLPISMGGLSSLQSLNLRNNRLSGAIPGSLKNCTNLQSFDIGENNFSGNIPTWIGETFSKIVVLNFRSNKFHGLLPVNLCHLTTLQILDLADNHLSGTIPTCIHNFSAMTTVDVSVGNEISYMYGIVEDASVVTKGRMVKYDDILNLVRSIDLSMNYFSGHIPVKVTNLEALQSLNLSHNSFTGRIPEKIGAMKSLESLDFSQNQLSGEIPRSFSSLTFLNHLNLSNNSLSGKIPLSTQLQSLDASSFIGNDLCGPPLLESCIESENVPEPEVENGHEDEDKVNWFYVSMALGFVVGFWFVVGPLLVSRRWKYKYCYFLDHLCDKIVRFVRKCC